MEGEIFMNQSIISVRVNENDKKKFEMFCNSIGLNISNAVNLFIKTVLREQKIPFEIKNDSFEDEVCKKLKEAENEMENNTKRYSEEEILESMKKKLK